MREASNDCISAIWELISLLADSIASILAANSCYKDKGGMGTIILFNILTVI